ncbi:unnamed protein product [Prunus armeniaca]|uniref:Uncharacterized protein n=1 Tax=Prunus armeniaca TaxID=36596 RepID=A0A6J5X6V4_PRUAR|nr:unnamed protein product [Prunus armeniaca]
MGIPSWVMVLAPRPCGCTTEEATGQWLGAATSGATIPAAIWWFTEVIASTRSWPHSLVAARLLQ